MPGPTRRSDQPRPTPEGLMADPDLIDCLTERAAVARARG